MTEKTDNEAAMAEIEKALEAEGIAAADMAMGTAKSADDLFDTVASKIIDEAKKVAPGGPSPGLRDIAAGMVPDPSSTPVPRWMLDTSQPSVLPLSDLRERIAILTAAGVTHYRDAGVELRLDPEAQKKDGRTEPKTERF